jgi:hypothetical protein
MPIAIVTGPIRGLGCYADCSATITNVVPRRAIPQKSTRSVHTLQHTPFGLAIADFEPVALSFEAMQLVCVGVIRSQAALDMMRAMVDLYIVIIL